MTSRVKTLGDTIVTQLEASSGPDGDTSWVVSEWSPEFFWGPEKSEFKHFNELEVFVIPGDRIWSESTNDRCEAGFLQEMHLTVVEKVGKPTKANERGDTEKIDCLVELTEQLGCWVQSNTTIEQIAEVTLVNLENIATPFEEEFMSKYGLFVSEWRMTYRE